jgi:hypothetical protein
VIASDLAPWLVTLLPWQDAAQFKLLPGWLSICARQCQQQLCCERSAQAYGALRQAVLQLQLAGGGVDSQLFEHLQQSSQRAHKMGDMRLTAAAAAAAPGDGVDI